MQNFHISLKLYSQGASPLASLDASDVAPSAIERASGGGAPTAGAKPEQEMKPEPMDE